MDVIQFMHENNKDFNEKDHLIKQETEKNNKHNLIVILPNNNNSRVNNNIKTQNVKTEEKYNESKKNLHEKNNDSDLNSFTDYSSIDCDSLTDSSNKWQQNDVKNEEEMINDIDDNLKAKEPNNSKNNSYRAVLENNDVIENDIEENLVNNKENDDSFDKSKLSRPKKSRLKPLLAEILNSYDDSDEKEKNEDYTESQKILTRPDRPTTRRGRGQDFRSDSRNSHESDYVPLSILPIKTSHEEPKHDTDFEIKEELEVLESTRKPLTPKVIINKSDDSRDQPKIVEVFNFEENSIHEINEAIYTPPLPIDEDDTILEENEYVTLDRIVNENDKKYSNNTNNYKINNNNHNNNFPSSLPKIQNSYDNHVKNSRQTSTKTDRNYSNSPYSKYHEFQPGRITTLSNLKDYKLLKSRDRHNLSRNTNKSTDSKTTFNTNSSSTMLHSRKMNQEELLKSINRLSYVPKRNFEHQRFTTLHDKFSNVDINAVSLRLYSSKTYRNKEMKHNEKPAKQLNKIEIDKMVIKMIFLTIKYFSNF
jgi:hypothetical protein